MKLPKTLYLNLKTWRCGGDSKLRTNRMGRGPTDLLNSEGYSCCLGQWIGQTDSSLNIYNHCDPIDILDCNIATLVRKNESLYNSRVNSRFSECCMEINDDKRTTVEEKIIKLRKILKKYRRRLVVK